MVNAPEWLNQKFPTKESREKAKQLSLYKSGLQINDTNDPDRGIYKLHCVNLAGELDLSDFGNLEFFGLYEQDSLVKLKGLEHLTKLVYFYVDKCSRLQPPYTFLDSWKKEITQTQELNQKLQGDNQDLLKDIQNYKQSLQRLERKITTQEQNLTTLENQLHQTQQKYQNHLHQEKTQLTQEIQLIKEVIQ